MIIFTCVIVAYADGEDWTNFVEQKAVGTRNIHLFLLVITQVELFSQGVSNLAHSPSTTAHQCKLINKSFFSIKELNKCKLYDRSLLSQIFKCIAMYIGTWLQQMRVHAKTTNSVSPLRLQTIHQDHLIWSILNDTKSRHPSSPSLGSC